MNKFKKWLPYVFLSPTIVWMMLFAFYPLGYLAYLSTTSWNLINPEKEFVGLDNYIKIFKSDQFYSMLENTFVYFFMAVPVTLALAVLLALWLSRNSRIHQFATSTVFIPHIVSLVAVSMVWMWLMDPAFGLLNYVLDKLSLSTSKWLTSADSAMLAIVVVTIWKSVGYFTLIILSGLGRISSEIKEAVRMDARPSLYTFYKITLPLLSPTLFFVFFIAAIAALQVFDTVKIMTNGGPAGSTTTIVFYIYDYAFSHFQIGFASAVSIVLMLIISILMLVYYKGLAGKVQYH